MALDSFSAFQFVVVWHAPEAVAEIQTTISCDAFCLLILQLELSHNAI